MPDRLRATKSAARSPIPNCPRPSFMILPICRWAYRRVSGALRHWLGRDGGGVDRDVPGGGNFGPVLDVFSGEDQVVQEVAVEHVWPGDGAFGAHGPGSAG